MLFDQLNQYCFAYWFCDIIVVSNLGCLFPVAQKCICRLCKNYNIPVKLTYLKGSFISIHIRHPDIHQNQIDVGIFPARNNGFNPILSLNQPRKLNPVINKYKNQKQFFSHYDLNQCLLNSIHVCTGRLSVICRLSDSCYRSPPLSCGRVF